MKKLRAVICAVWGHSPIITRCFGYLCCGRCGAQVGDELSGTIALDNTVIVGHNCDVCRANFARLTWRQRLLTPDPFAKD